MRRFFARTTVCSLPCVFTPSLPPPRSRVAPQASVATARCRTACKATGRDPLILKEIDLLLDRLHSTSNDAYDWLDISPPCNTTAAATPSATSSTPTAVAVAATAAAAAAAYPPVLHQFVVSAARRRCPMVTDGETLLLTAPSLLLEEDTMFPLYHFESYICVSDFHNNDTLWRVYVCTKDTKMHRADTVLELDHWDYLLEVYPEMVGEANETGGRDADANTVGMQWPQTKKQGDELIQSCMRGEQDNDRHPLVFTNLVRFLQSVERTPNRRYAVQAPEDLLPWPQTQ
jgi:hypothetical protein